MTRITANTMTRRVLNDLALANERLTNTQRKLSSGRELNKPSDNPTQVGRAIHLRREMEAAQQHQRNAEQAQGWSDVTDSALSAIADALLRVRDLTSQAANDAAGPESRKAIGEELKGLLDSIKTAGNASYGGRYVFSGTMTNVPPYGMGADDAFHGDTQPIMREIGPGVQVQVNITGMDFLGNATTGLISTLRQVMDHVANGNSGQISNDLNVLDTRLDQLNSVRATIGATTNRLEVALSRLTEYEGTTLELLNNTESADIAKSMIEFSTQQAAMQAGLKAGANIVQNSLLDFLR